MKIQKATRQGIKPLIGLYGESGCGKTMSALLLARGMAGGGRIIMLDTESGRGSLYADVIEGGYDVCELTNDFSPKAYVTAIKEIETENPAILVIDSASHEWSGLGGVTDMATEQEGKGMKGLGVWKVPKMEHAKFMLTLLQSPLPIICCLRAKHKSRQVKNAQGRTEIVKDDFTSPIQADDFIFEMTAHMEIMPDHSARVTKCSHPSLGACFPSSGPISVEHGKRLAEWCRGGAVAAPSPAPAGLTALKKRAAALSCEIYGGLGKEAMQAKWREKGIIPPTVLLSELKEADLEEVINKLEIEIKQRERTN